MATPQALKLAILISGRGSNFQAIHQAIVNKKLTAEIKLVLSDQAQAAGLDYARQHQLPTLVIEKQAQESRSAFDQRLQTAIDASGANWVVLAGYMRLLSPEFVRHYQGRVINIHPSLLPKFPGLRAQRQALAAGEEKSGCTVHFVDEGCDTGPIIAQREVPVLADDTEESLSARILTQEHQLYPEVLQKIADGKIEFKARG